MPRWYDVALIWLGLQLIAALAIGWCVEQLAPRLFEVYFRGTWAGVVVVVGVVAYLVKRRLIARDDAKRALANGGGPAGR
jgi:hypothetical protein